MNPTSQHRPPLGLELVVERQGGHPVGEAAWRQGGFFMRGVRSTGQYILRALHPSRRIVGTAFGRA